MDGIKEYCFCKHPDCAIGHPEYCFTCHKRIHKTDASATITLRIKLLELMIKDARIPMEQSQCTCHLCVEGTRCIKCKWLVAIDKYKFTT